MVRKLIVFKGEMQMEKFLSTYGNPMSALDTAEKLQGMKELIHEFCTAFGVKVTHNTKTTEPLVRRSVDVVDNNGFPLGQLQISKNSGGDRLYIYECEGLIKKQKSSANSGQSARDSTKINGLIKSLKNNNEYPKAEGRYSQFEAVIRYGFGSMSRDRSTNSISLDKDAFLGIAHEILGTPNHGYQIDRNFLQRSIDLFNREEAKQSKGITLKERFARGMTVIKMPHAPYRGASEDFYLIGKATYDSVKDDVLTIGDFIRHDFISDTPYAGLAVMCKTYMAKSNHGSTDDNAFGIMRGDNYISDLDITNCYGGNMHLLLVPDNAE
jgi:hypothetical protein